MNINQFRRLFPLGSHLCREPMPAMSELKADMQILKSKGFNLIKLQENWMVDEPVEGECHFEKYHELIDYAGKLDMGVYLGLTCEQAPNWLWEKYPDCRMIRRDGLPVPFQAQTTLYADGKPGPCYDNPGAMSAQLSFIKRLVTELGIHENIVVWNTWQEIGYMAEELCGDKVCYCANTLRAYKNWLSTLYKGDIGALNSHWNTRYSSFEAALPDRCKRRVCIPQQYYYRYFMDNVQTANVLTARCRAIKEADALNRPVFAHKAGPELGSGVDWTYAGTQDFFGVSCYPAWTSGHEWDDLLQSTRLPRHETLVKEMWDSLACRIDYIRCASAKGAPVWVAEFQGGPVNTDFHPGRSPDADDMRRWMLTALGAGATAISFWITRAEIMAPETNGFSLLDSEGDTTERLEEAAKVGRAVQEYPDIFAENNKPQADVAILVDEWKYQLLNCMSFAPDAFVYDFRGWYKLLWSAGIPCDFVEVSQLEEVTRLTEVTRHTETQKHTEVTWINKAKTGGYKTIIVPMPLSMSDEVAAALIRFATAGGNVILEGGCGRLNETAFAVRGEMNGIIREALGVKVGQYALVREPDEPGRWSQPERTWGEYEESGFLEGKGILEGAQVKANFFVETYTVADAAKAEVCLTWNGKPAGIVCSTGKGKLWLIGSCLGPNATAYAEPESSNAVVKLLAKTGVMKKHDGRLLVTERVAETRKALVVTNPEKEPLTEEIALPEGCVAFDLLNGTRIDNGEDKAIITVAPLDVRALIVVSNAH